MPDADEPESTMPRRKQLPVVGTLIEKVKQLDFENVRKIGGFNIEARKEWKKRTESGEAKTVQNLQKIGTNMLDPSWVGTRVEYLAYYDIDEKGNERELRLVGGQILEVNDGTWLIPGARTKCYKKMRQQMCYGTPLRKQIANSAGQLKNFARKSSIKIVRVAGERRWK